MLNSREAQILAKYYKKMSSRKDTFPNYYQEEDSLSPIYIVENNFVVCQLLYNFRFLRVGVAKRNPAADEWNMERAKDISLYRALSSTTVINVNTWYVRSPGSV